MEVLMVEITITSKALPIDLNYEYWEKPAFQFGLNVGIGILTIISIAASYYYGIIRF